MQPQPRIEPLAPPYAPELDALLTRMTPPGAPSILALFRVLAHNPELASRCPSDDYLRETVRLMSFKAKAANTRAGNIMTIVAAER